MTEIKKIVCTDCGAEIITTGNEEVGDILECDECGTEIEITSVNPLNYRELVEEK